MATKSAKHDSHHRSRPFPAAQSILWTPRSEPYAHPLNEPAVVVTQGALREVMRHVRSVPDQELLGFLLGERYECPETRRRFVVVNATIRTGHVITEESPVPIPETEWRGQQLEVRRRRATLVGWYRSAAFVGPLPVSLDLAAQRERFGETWPCALVVSIDAANPAGGIFRAFADARAGGAFVPFHELVDDDAIFHGAYKRTVIDWTNYETRALIERDAPAHAPLAAAPPRAERAEPIAILVPPAPDPPPPSSPRATLDARRRRAGIIAGAILAALLVLALLAWMHRPELEPPDQSNIGTGDSRLGTAALGTRSATNAGRAQPSAEQRVPSPARAEHRGPSAERRA